jgi:nanoRNase/pAp phosphatase (c-di-AMP/oligoRNAs hydrolase)
LIDPFSKMGYNAKSSLYLRYLYMDLSTTEQIFEQIKKAGKILIALPENLGADTVASGLALRRFLTKQQKDVILVSSGHLPENIKFLPESEVIKNSVNSSKSLVVTLDTTLKKLEEISYETTDDKVSIFLKSKNGEFSAEDISFSKDKLPLDLIVILDARSLEDLGKFYEENADLFFETPKINIDNKSGNEYFGSVNMVDVTATSISEILTGLFQEYEQQLIDEDVATCLLAGIIAKTQSFQHVQTTPKAFLKASELVSLGGRQQEIIKNIYKTKSLPLLKLWGRALARMKVEENKKAVYSMLNYTDFEKAEGSAKDVFPALKEFLDNISGYNIIALFTESTKGLNSMLAAVHEQIPAQDFLSKLELGGKVLNLSLGNYKVVQLDDLPGTLESLEAKFVETLKKL